MLVLQTGSAELRDAVNSDSDTEVVATTGAVTTALSVTKGITVLAPTGNTTGLTLAAPTRKGQKKLIANTTAFSAQVTIADTAFATQNVFSFVAAAANVVGPSLELEAVDVSATTTPSLKWVVRGAAGFVAGTSAVA